MSSLRLLKIVLFILAVAFLGACHDEVPKIKYKLGIFPDSVMNIEGLNSMYDDYNVDLEASVISSLRSVVFSSNRQSSGGEFDLVHGIVWYNFGQTTGTFSFGGEMRTDPFVDNLTATFNTSGNDFGPLRFFNSRNGLEYMAASSETATTGLDIFYASYIPVYTTIPDVEDPVPASAFNSLSDDAYLSLNQTLDTAYFCSDRSGDFDIYMSVKPFSLNVEDWFASSVPLPVRADSVNSSFSDKCPHVTGRYMVFASDRPGGSGGYDLYYSVFRGGKWSSPVNMGPAINSPSNEYRPVIGVDLAFENLFLIFSSDRPGGKGSYDLYITGISLPR